MKRKAKISRKTKETSISVDLNIDGKGKYKIDTGIGFLNHMLEQLSKHSSMDMNIRAKGDTNIDLIEGQVEYTFFRSTDDGTSSVTVGGTSGSNTYGVADVLEATFRQNRTQTTQSDAAMTKIDRSTYSSLSAKLSKGTPSQYFVQRFIDKTTVTVYPAPESTAASKDMHIFFVKRIQDADSTYTDATDVPYRFVPCMIAGLSYYLAIKYAPQRVQELKLLYEDELLRAEDEDGSSNSTYISPKVYYPGVN